MGIFDFLKSGLKRTSDLLNTDIRDLFKSGGRLVDDAFLDDVRTLLIRTDMGVEASTSIIDQLKTEFRGRVVQLADLLVVVKAKLLELLPKASEPIHWAETGPTVIMMVGVNGSGKTTSIAKLAHRFRTEGKSVVLGAGDTFRAAAVEQLTIWAQRLGCELVRGEAGVDPASVAHRAVAVTLQNKADVCIVDTAGRLHTQVNLMQELSKVHRVIAKQIPSAPHEVLLVLDATGGQNGIRQAEGFTEAVKCTGIVLSKLDGSAKGGVVVPIRKKFDLSVKFVGLGEKPEDMALFDPAAFVEALFAGV